MNDFENLSFHEQWKNDTVRDLLKSQMENKCSGRTPSGELRVVSSSQRLNPECLDCAYKASLDDHLKGFHIEEAPKFKNDLCPKWKMKD